MASTSLKRPTGLGAPSRMWRKDFGSVPAPERRAARYALQLIARMPVLHHRLSDVDFLGALWTLSLPLIDPAWLAKLANLYASPKRGADDDFDDEPFLCDLGVPGGRSRKNLPDRAAHGFLRAAFAGVSERLLRRLADQDGSAPTHPTVATVAGCLGLDPTEAAMLDLMEKRNVNPHFRTLMREAGCSGVHEIYPCVAAMLDRSAAEVHEAASARGRLHRLRLLNLRHASNYDLEDFLVPEDFFMNLVFSGVHSEDALIAALIEPAAPSRWGLADFAHLARDGQRLTASLAQAAATGSHGVNALFYGAPGTGKTEFAQAVAVAAGLKAYRVRSATDQGGGLTREGRLGAYAFAQQVLRSRRDCLLIFDEVEDAFGNDHGGLLALFGRRGGSASGDKGWMNATLEDNPVPAVWITNDAESMDPAFLRRFLLPVAFSTPPRSVRRSMAEAHLGDCALPDGLIDELAADEALLPAQFGAARRLLDLQPHADAPVVVREGIAATRRLLHGSARAHQRQPATVFDVAYLNIAGGIAPARIAQALARNGQGRLCFFGPPGTGKTQFAQVLAEALDRELVACAASDILSPYVGQTEQNLAALFNGIDAERCVLLLDEVDSLLQDRTQAQRSWERTQVNELLQQMERFPGILIAATNLGDTLDAAALRRFDFKLQFRPLSIAQRISLFAREVLGPLAGTDDVPALIARRLESLDQLTPGDFANVVRQRDLLGEPLDPEAFLRRLILECRWKARRPEMVSA